MTTKTNWKFIDGSGVEVPGYEFKNPDGSIGGWVAENANIGENVYIDPTAIVGPNATVRPGAILREGTEVDENEVY